MTFLVIMLCWNALKIMMVTQSYGMSLKFKPLTVHKTVQAVPKSPERESKLVDELRGISGVQLLDVVVKKLSEDNHMHFYPERAQIMSALLDSAFIIFFSYRGKKVLK